MVSENSDFYYTTFPGVVGETQTSHSLVELDNGAQKDTRPSALNALHRACLKGKKGLVGCKTAQEREATCP